MQTKFIAMLAGLAVAAAGPAVADPGGGHGGGPGTGGNGMGASMSGGPGVGMNSGGFGPGGRPGDMIGRDFGAQMSTDARARADTMRQGDSRDHDFGVQTRTTARANSQGPTHASATGIAHANANSVLAGGTTVVAGPLTGLTVGMPVVDSTNQAIGTVQRIVTSSDGKIRNVLVRSSDGGRIYPLGTGSLSLSGGTLVTSSWSRSGR